MKLQKFDKNKKLKIMFIVSVIGIILIIGGISLYRTFALYKIEKTFNVLEGTIPYFSKEYKEKLLNGADPVIAGDLVPVLINEKDGSVTKADIKNKWYEYGNKQWANAVILTEDGKKQNFADNAKIDEKYIESYFVWIPKYSYKLFDMGNYTTISSRDKAKLKKAIEIEFGLKNTANNESNANHKECATPMLANGVQGASAGSGACSVGEWMTHPAFLAFKTNGIWVGKFETGELNASSSGASTQNSYSSEILKKVIIKPDSFAWSNSNVKTMFQLGYNYKKDLFSHMMKNTEWGAVAYLTQSNYGKCVANVCSYVETNNYSGYKTGYTSSNGTYTNTEGVKASTTGNYSGIYDMSGGSWEYMASFIRNINSTSLILPTTSGFTTNDLLDGNLLSDVRYYDLYNYHVQSGNTNNWNRRILGDATGEMGPFGTACGDNSWSIDSPESCLVHSIYPFINRGGAIGYATNSDGLFAFHVHGGNAQRVWGFRIVLAPQ